MLGDANGVTSSEVGDDERVVGGDGAVEVRVDDLVRSRGEDLPQLELRSCERKGGSARCERLELPAPMGEQQQVVKLKNPLCEMLVRLAGISWARIASASASASAVGCAISSYSDGHPLPSSPAKNSTLCISVSAQRPPTLRGKLGSP